MKKWWPKMEGWGGIILLALLAFATPAAAHDITFNKGQRFAASVVCTTADSVKVLVLELDAGDNDAAVDLLNDMDFECVAIEQSIIPQPYPFWPTVVKEKHSEIGQYTIYTALLVTTNENVFVYHKERPSLPI